MEQTLEYPRSCAGGQQEDRASRRWRKLARDHAKACRHDRLHVETPVVPFRYRRSPLLPCIVCTQSMSALFQVGNSQGDDTLDDACAWHTIEFDPNTIAPNILVLILSQRTQDMGTQKSSPAAFGGRCNAALHNAPLHELHQETFFDGCDALGLKNVCLTHWHALQ